MLIGMVLANDKKTIVPFIEGTTARVYNTETRQSSDHPNPAVSLTEGRRGAVVNWMSEQGVEILCSPPGTLCELSYGNAKEKKLHFYRLEHGTSFSELQKQLDEGKITLTEALPANEIEPSL